MKTYEKYKDSDIDWIGEIPEKWGIKKIKHRCYVKARVGWKGLKSTEFLTEGYSYLVTGSDFKNDTVDWKECYHIDRKRYEEDPYIQLQEEDLLITKDGTIGKLAIVSELDKPACLNSGIFVVRSLNEDFKTSFLFWILKSKIFTQFNDYTKYGSTIQHLYQNVFVEFSFPFPKKQEQTAIANYLDKKTAAIDQLIADKKQLVALYQEEKTAIINQAVTKGINPNVKLKDSGIEWLGEIPEHWAIVPLKYLVEVKDGTHDSPKPVPESEDSFPLITSKDIKDNVLNFDNCNHITREDYIKINARSNVTYNDIIMPMIGTVGGAVIVNSKIDFSIKNVALFKTSSKDSLVCSRYLKYFLDSKVIYNQFEEESRGGVQNFVALGMLRNIKVFTISESEQTQIVQHIEKESTRIDAKITKAEKYIKLLTEYRTALISEVVTGKIKVIE